MTIIKKIYVTVTLLLIASIGNAYGDTYNSLTCKEIDNCCPCEPTCCGNVFFSGDFLYWRTFESGLDVCRPRETFDCVTSNGRVISEFKGKARNPRFRWDPGFRIGVGYTPDSCGCCNGWGIGAFWTDFHTRANRFEDGDREHRWKLNLDVVDVILGYDVDLNSCLHLRPLVGARWAYIDQKLHFSNYSNSSSSSSSYSSSSSSCPLCDSYSSSSSSYSSFSSSSSDPHFIKNRNKQEFSGVGPLLGLEADWKFGCGFSFYVSGAVSWLYGKFSTKFDGSDTTIDTDSFYSVRKHLDANVTAADAALGIRWQTCICGSLQLLLQLGVEHHRYFDFNRIANYGDLSFDGANFSAAIEF